jgi:hypothetical protein
MNSTLEICRADKKKWSTKYLKMDTGVPYIDVFKDASQADHKGQILLQVIVSSLIVCHSFSYLLSWNREARLKSLIC